VVVTVRKVNPLTPETAQPLDDPLMDRPIPFERPSSGRRQPLETSRVDEPQKVTNKGGSTRRTKKQNPLLNPPVLATAGMLLLVGELVLLATVGWLWLIVVNLVVAMVAFAAMLAWRRKGKGGLLDRLLGSVGRSGASPRSGKSGRSSPGGASKGGRGNPLSRLFGPGRASGPGGGASRRKPGLFDALRGRRPGASSKPGASRDASGSPRGKASKLWPFGGGKTKGGGPGGSRSPGGSGSKGGGSGSPSGGGGKKPGRKKKPGGWWSDFRDSFNERRGEGRAEDEPKKAKGRKKADRRADLVDDADLVDEIDEASGPAADVDSDWTPGYELPPRPGKEERRNPAPKPQEEPMIRHEDDASLQRWGRNLKDIAPALDELATSARQQTDVANAVAQSVAKLALQGENDLPAHASLTSEAESIASELRALNAENEVRADKMRTLAARGEALALRYGTQHETDEGRLNGERGSRSQEKRADVGTAEQDT
jgi:hypothetical protein